MTVDRERATAARDLPHEHAGPADGACEVCGADQLDARHVDWEKACAASASPQPGLVRELGS